MGKVLEVDIAFLGSGVAGYSGAIRARQRGATAAVVERDVLGGTCLNRGCMPAKALIHCAEVARSLRRAGEFGIKASGPETDWPRVLRHVAGTVRRLRKGVEYLMNHNRVEVLRGRAHLQDARTIEIEDGDGRSALRARKVVICTGSAPAALPIPGGAENTITSDDLWTLDQQPQRLAVIGGGFIGCESGYGLAGLGSQVTIFEMTEQILPEVESDLAAELVRTFKRMGVKVHAPARVMAVEARGGAKVVKYATDAGEAELEVDAVLLAVGRRSVFEDSGAQEIGVKVERGRLVVNRRMETGVEGVYAAGDVIGPPLLAHAGIAEAQVAVTNALGGDAEMDYRAMPFCIYTSPEIAVVGLTEKQAQQQGLPVRVGAFPFLAQGKAVATGEREGFVKVLVAEDRLVGAQMVGPHVTELIAEAAAAIWARTPIEVFAAGIRAHPTLAEATEEAVGDALGHPLHK